MKRLVASGLPSGGRTAAAVALVMSLAATGCDSGAEGSGTAGHESSEATSQVESGPHRLVYATRSSGQVTVFRRPLGPGDPEELFTYRESDGLPDVAVSPDGRLVAYVIDGLQLHVREIATGNGTILVEGEGRKPPAGADATPPHWSKDGMNYLTPQEQED